MDSTRMNDDLVKNLYGQFATIDKSKRKTFFQSLNSAERAIAEKVVYAIQGIQIDPFSFSKEETATIAKINKKVSDMKDGKTNAFSVLWTRIDNWCHGRKPYSIKSDTLVFRFNSGKANFENNKPIGLRGGVINQPIDKKTLEARKHLKINDRDSHNDGYEETILVPKNQHYKIIKP
jgi:hypothetical protein